MQNVSEKYKFNPTHMPAKTMEIVVVSGTWYEMGCQYVQQVREEYSIRAAEMFGKYLEIFETPEKVKSIIQNYLAATRTETPQVIDILNGMADESGLDIEIGAIILYGMSMIRVELEKPTQDQCSTSAAWGRATKNGEFVCAANVDMEVSTTNYLPAMLCYPEDGIPYICGENFHRNGLNEKGLAMILSGGNNAGEGGAVSGLDRHMWNDANIVSFASCSSAKEAMNLYAKYKYVVGCNQFIGDKTRDCMVIEFTGSKFIVRRAGDYGETDYLVTANGYLAPELQDNHCKGPMYWDMCKTRQWTYDEIYQKNIGNLTLESLVNAHSNYDYYIPKGWSFNPEYEDGIWWHNDDTNPYKEGWHKGDENVLHGPWSPQMRGEFCAAARFALDVDNLTFYGMRGETNSLYSNTPGSVGAFWEITLGGDAFDVVQKAKLSCDKQITISAFALDASNADLIQVQQLTKAREKMLEGINYTSLASLAKGYTNMGEQNFYLGKALSAFCAGQAYSKLARKSII